MGMGGEIGVLLAYAAGIIVIYILGYIMLAPLKVVVRLLINSGLGGLALILINYAGESFNLHIPINIFSAIITGILGIPGIVLLYFSEQLFS